MQTYPIVMESSYEYAGKIWFINQKDNIIYELDLAKHIVIPVCIIPQRKEKKYEHVVVYKDKFFVTSAYGNKIFIYNTTHMTWRCLKYESKEGTVRGSALEGIVVKDNLLYLIPCVFDQIVCVDMREERVSCIGTKLCQDGHDLPAYATGSVWEDAGNIYFTAITSNTIYKFDMETAVYEEFICEKLHGGGAGIIGDDNGVWILPLTADRLLYWDREGRFMEEYTDFPEGYNPGVWSFNQMSQTEDDVLLMPRDVNMCIAVSKRNGTMRKLDFGREDYKEEIARTGIHKPIYCLGEVEDGLLLSDSVRGNFYVIRKGEKALCKCSLNFAKSETLADTLPRDQVVCENGIVNLDMLIRSLC